MIKVNTISLIYQVIAVSIINLQQETKHQLNVNRDQWHNSYDYIVVGAGTAGAVVANRLAEDPKINVLLLEAGRPASVLTDIPGVNERLRNSDFDWNYTTVVQDNYAHTVNGAIELSRGKVLGGTGAINGMVYNRGNRLDFDDWVTTFGAKGWSYDEILPYFIKSENNIDYNLVQQDRQFHGTGGPITVSSDSAPQPILINSLRAFMEMGFDLVNINGAKQTGTMIPQETISEKGIRTSTGNAYIDPNPYPHNLHILTDAFVVKLLLEKSDSCVKTNGVQFVKGHKLYEVMAQREVIVSGGTFNSPQLLMLSGIGPKEQLQRFNIDVKVDLPVGQHLQNHPVVRNIFAMIKPGVWQDESPLPNIEQMYTLYTNKSGPLSRDTNGLTYFSTHNNPNKDWPNALIYFYHFPITPEIMLRYPNRTHEWFDYISPYFGSNALNLRPNLGKIRSFGQLTLQSDNPYVYPLIDPRYMSHPQDFEDMVETVKLAFFYLARTSIAKYVDLIPGPIPGCQLCHDRPIYECDEYIRCYIRECGDSLNHPTGTCRMGDVHRPDVVVDERLNVKNVCGLRVCDASVMPSLPNANVNAATVMIAEKCADMIKQDQKGPSYY